MMEDIKEEEKNNVLPYIQALYYDIEKKIFVINNDRLKELLLDEKIKDKHVCIISVAGAFRKGKSFLLNFFIRYLKYIEKNGMCDDNEWIGNDGENLIGFPWRGGSERETNGILLWSEPFKIKLTNNEEIIVLLMDTQGAFDNNSTIKECATVFAMSTMLSSCQIYNISGNLQEDYLSHLQLFTEYGKMALEERSDLKPFQDLIFLIRDWSYPYEYEYGYSNEFLEKNLKISDIQHKELQCVRKHIRDCFENVDLYLLPHPGIKVAITPNFNGCVNDIDDAFIEYLSQFITTIFSPDTLRPKICQGSPIKCQDVLTYFNSYIKIFESDKMPEPKNIMMATAEANHLVALNNAINLYENEMSQIFSPDKPYQPQSILLKEHENILQKATLQFLSCKKFGSDLLLNTFKEKLEKEILQIYQHFCLLNDNKQISSFKFILTAFIILLISLLFSQILDVIGLDMFMFPFSIISIICFLMILFCIYAQFRGGYTQYIYFINTLPDYLIDQIKILALDNLLNQKKLN